MKKFVKLTSILAIALVAVLCFALAGCDPKSGPDYLQVATNAEFAPFEYMEGSEIVGVDVDIANALAKQMGFKGANIINMKFESIIASVQTKPDTVGIAGMTVTPKRSESVNFSDTYFNATQVVLYKGDARAFNDEASVWDFLKGKKIGTSQGYTGDTMISNNLQETYKGTDENDAEIDIPGILFNSGATNTTYDNGALAVEDLVNGKLDAVVIDKEPAKVFAQTSKYKNQGVKVGDIGLGNEEYAVAVNKNNTELLKKINEAMAAIKASGEYQKILDKWFGSAE